MILTEHKKLLDMAPADLGLGQILALQILCADLIETLQREQACVDYYADSMNWRDWADDEYDNSVIVPKDLSVPEGLCDRRGGKFARETRAMRGRQ